MFVYRLIDEIFEPFIGLLYFATIILILIVFCIFLVNLRETSKIINFNILIPTIFYSLLFLFLQNYFSIPLFIPCLNGVLIYDDLVKFLHFFILICTLIYFQIQYYTTLKTQFHHFENNILILLSLIGLLLLCSTYNLIVLYLAIELQSLAFYVLAASKEKSPFSTEAALKYFILGSIGSGFLLYGISIVYGITGTLNLGNIFLLFTHINQFENISFLIAFFYAFLFLTSGLLFKLGSAPFHTWLPDVYEGSPNHITLFFATIPKIALIGILIRLFFYNGEDVLLFFSNIFYFCAIISIFIGSLVAIQQKKIKRLLAYSSISHVGFILIGFVVGTYQSIEIILFYLIIYMVMSVNIWSIFLSIKFKNHSFKFLTSFTNFSKINPILALIIILNLFSLAGIPPLAGFFSKLFILTHAIKHYYIGLAILGATFSILSAFYYLRLIKIIFFDKTLYIETVQTIYPRESIIIMITSQLLCFYVFFPQYLLNYIEKIVLFFLS